MKQRNLSRQEDWVDVYDDDLMISLGIHPSNAIPRDLTVWTKSKNEKDILRSLRCSFKHKMYCNSTPQKVIPVKAKLIVQLKKNKKFPHTTYSIDCWMHEINNHLLRFYQQNNKTGYNECLILKYVYNGKTYKPEERPFWFGN